MDSPALAVISFVSAEILSQNPNCIFHIFKSAVLGKVVYCPAICYVLVEWHLPLYLSVHISGKGRLVLADVQLSLGTFFESQIYLNSMIVRI